MEFLKHLQVVRRNLLCFPRVENVFSQVSQHGLNIFLPQLACRGNRVVKILARHESGDTSFHEGVPACVFPQPPVLRSRQKHRADHGHQTILLV
jgi:hypothetical protein